MDLHQALPAPEDLLKLEPEEFALDLLRVLYESDGRSNRGRLNRHNFTLREGEVGSYAGELYEDVARHVTEAWLWLEREGLLAPTPRSDRDWCYVTRRGARTLESATATEYQSSNLLPRRHIDPQLLADVEAAFIKSQFDRAVRDAFRRVEIRVRDRSKLDIKSATDLMNKAFSRGGVLADASLEEAEQRALRELFSGAMGSYRNPHTHSDVGLNDVGEALELVLFANHLLRRIPPAVTVI